jgi:predicted nuclease with TOPRIM domain
VCSIRNRETRVEEKYIREQIKKIKGYPKVGEEEEITNMRREIEQAIVVEERLIGRIKEMEDENNYLREELDRFHEKLTIKKKFEKSFISLEVILSSKICHYDRFVT